MLNQRQTLAATVTAAFVLRLVAGLWKGPDFVGDGYSLYADLSQSFWDGQGLCYAPGAGCAIRMPLYPVLVAPFLALGAAYPWLIIVKALVGAMQPLLAFALASRLFDARAATIAAIGTALNPYAIAHGPSFQETVFFNALIALAVLLLMRCVDSDDPGVSLGAGLALALATLMTARLALFVPVAAAWVFGARRGPVVARAKHAALMLAPLVLVLGGWMARNTKVVGAPVLTTEFGLSLWVANHPATMAYLPNQSIDRVTRVAWESLSGDERARLQTLSDSPVAQDRYLTRLAMDYVRSHPAEVLYGSLQKVAVNLAGWLSPAREWPIQLAYFLVFAPINAFAFAGWWRARGAGVEHGLIGLLALSFALTTAVFWAHTSHRSFLHVFLIVYAASWVTARRATPTAGSAAAAFRCSAS